MSSRYPSKYPLNIGLELFEVVKANPKLILANNIKVDMKIMLESSRNFDTIIIPSNCTNDMVIPLSIHKNEINTFYKISSSHKVHKTILWNGFYIKIFFSCFETKRHFRFGIGTGSAFDNLPREMIKSL